MNVERPLKKSVRGLVVPRTDLPHCYSVFGEILAELVKLPEPGTSPVRIVNASARPVVIVRKTGLGDFESLEGDL